MAGELKHKDVGPELTYNEYHATDSHTIDGVDAGTVIAGKATLAEVKADTDIATAITNSHASGSDNQDLSGYSLTSHLHAGTYLESETDPVFTAWDKDYGDLINKPTIPDELADLSGDATHRLVTDTEKSTWNGKTDLATVKADTDVASAISLKHTQGTDQGLDTGGANAVTAAQAKAGYTHSGVAHAPSDAVSLATVKADADVSDAILKKHVAVTVSAPISLSGQALSLVNDAAAAITEIDTGALANSDTVIPTSKAVTTAIAGVSGSSQQLSHGRLTLESGVPVSSTDQTAKTILYFTPYVGNIISLYSGTAWEDKTFSEIHIDLTETQSCTTANGDATLTVADTSQLIVGMEVSGTGIAGGATISSITDATHLEMSANGTADATNNITFKIPASKVVDVFAYNLSGAAKLAFGPLWTNVTTRATALTAKDGVPVLTGSYSISGTAYTEGKLRWIGTVGTTATAGQSEDSVTGRYAWNKYNKVHKNLRSYNSNSQWSMTGTITFREFNNGSGQVRGKFVIGEPQSFQLAMSTYASAGDTSAVLGAYIDRDGASSYNVRCHVVAFYGWSGYAPFLNIGPAIDSEMVPAGYHYYTQYEYSTGNMTHLPGGGAYSHIHTTWEG